MKYRLLVNYGKPFEEKLNSKEELFNRLKELEKQNDKEDYPYFDVFIYDNKDKDFTEEMFKEFELMMTTQENVKNIVNRNKQDDKK